MECLTCGATTKNPKYCSRKCAGAGALHYVPPKIKTMGKCSNCGKEIDRKNKYCKECREEKFGISKKSKGQIGKKNGKYNPWALASIRTNARKKCTGIDSCEICGYNKHVEVCHIRPISLFSEDSLVSEINDRKNLIVLCPNCHWELDNGLLEL